MDFTQRVFTGGCHSPGEETTSVGVGPGVVLGAQVRDCGSHR